MSKAPEALPKRSLKDKLLRVGTSTGALLASALVIGEAPALASADKSTPKGNVPTRVETSGNKGHFIPRPPELKVSDELTQEDQITAESIQAMNQKKVQWNGVMVVHKPTKNASIGFTNSPSAYSDFSESEWIFFGPDKNFSHDKSPQLIVSDPLLLKWKVGGHDRLFALVYTPEGRPTFLDMKFAEDMGGVTFYAYKDSKPRPIAVGESSKAPNVDYEDRGRILDNAPADTTFADSHIKLRHGHLSDVLPHM